MANICNIVTRSFITSYNMPTVYAAVMKLQLSEIPKFLYKMPRHPWSAIFSLKSDFKLCQKSMYYHLVCHFVYCAVF